MLSPGLNVPLSVRLPIRAQDGQVNAWFLIREFLRWCRAFKMCLYWEQGGLRWRCGGAFGGHCNTTAQPFWYICSPCCNSRLVLLLPVLFCSALLCRREMLNAQKGSLGIGGVTGVLFSQLCDVSAFQLLSKSRK